MPRVSGRLGRRLLLAMGLILALAVAGLFLANRELRHLEFELTTAGGDARALRAPAERLAGVVEQSLLDGELVRGSDGWEGAEALKGRLDRITAELGEATAYRLTDGTGTPLLEGPTAPLTETGGSRILFTLDEGASGDAVGRLQLEVLTDGPAGAAGGPESVWLEASEEVDDPSAPWGRWSGFVSLLVGGLALFLMAGVIRGLVGPLERLTESVRRFGEGDLAARAPVKGDDEIAGLAGAFNEMAARVQQVDELRRNLVSDVAHELRTPLTNLRGQLEALLDGVYPMDRARLESLLEDALELEHLIDDLQDLALADAGGLVLNLVSVELEVEAAAALRSLEGLGEEHAPVEVALAGLPEVQGDPRRLRQVMRNLLTNAFRHTLANGRIRIAGRAEAEGVEIAVKDTGEGMAADELERVFDRFYRADPSRQRASGGSGLGLAIAREIVEAHGGWIRAESAPGEGATFRFYIPAGGGSVS